MHQKNVIQPFSEKTASQLQSNLQKHNKQNSGVDLKNCTENEKKSSQQAGHQQTKSMMNSANIMNMFSTGTDFSKKTQPTNQIMKKKKNEKENPQKEAIAVQTKNDCNEKVIVLDLQIDCEKQFQENNIFNGNSKKSFEKKSAEKQNSEMHQQNVEQDEKMNFEIQQQVIQKCNNLKFSVNENRDLNPMSQEIQQNFELEIQDASQNSNAKIKNDDAVLQGQEIEELDKNDSKLFIELFPEDIEPIKEGDPDFHAKRINNLFKQRIADYYKKEMKKMTQTDKIQIKDPQNLSEFSQSIYQNMKRDEVNFMVDPNYITIVQTEIRDTSRAFLLEWIIDVHRKFRLQPECLYVTQLIIDQYLSKKKILKSQLHLLGIATLLIATKYEEIYPPDLKELITISENKFDKEQVITMEKEILMTLGFILTAPSAYRFLQRFQNISQLYQDKEVFFYAQYIQEVSILDASLLQFRPSQIAAASLILSATQLKKTTGWTQKMVEFSGYSIEDLNKCVQEVRSFALEINPKFISTLKYKFSKPEYMKVANYTFNF